MSELLHSWLLSHPIWQSVITNAVVGIALLLLTIYWKVLVAFWKIPPQQLGTWLRKARVTASENRLYILQRANDDYKFAVSLFIRKLVFLLIFLTFILIPISDRLVLSDVPKPNLMPSFALPLSRLLHQNAFARAGFVVIPYYAFIFMAFRLLRFGQDYASFDATEDRILTKLNRLRIALGEKPYPSSTVAASRIKSPIEVPVSVLKPNVMVLHPKYGQGKVLALSRDHDMEIVTVNFENYGIKKLVSKFAQLRPI